MNSNNFNSNSTVNYDAAEKLLNDFHQQLSDHKKKQHNLIQNFTESNYKFGEVTSYFMSQINPILKSTADEYREQNKSLINEIQTLRAQLESLQQHIEKQKKDRMDMAHRIMKFCDQCINPTEFELFIGALFTALGYQVEHNGKTHDGGIDLIVRHFEKGKGVVQVKQYRRNTKVTEPQIRDLFGAMSAKQEVEYGIMVVLSDCTKEAKTWPDRENVSNLKIWTHKELVGLLEEKGDETLMEFIRLINDKHDQDMKQVMNNGINSNFVTPKHQHRSRGHHSYYKSSRHHSNYNNNHSSHHTSNHPSASKSNRKSSHHHRVHPQSTLSSAKKKRAAQQQQNKVNNSNNERLQRALMNFGGNNETNGNQDGLSMEQIRSSWGNFKFSGGDIMENKQDEGDQNKENMDNNDEHKENVLDNVGNEEYISPHKKASVVFNVDSNLSAKSHDNLSGEPSPNGHSSQDSSLLIDESQDSEDENCRGGVYGGYRKRNILNGNDNDTALNYNELDQINQSFSNGILSKKNGIGNGMGMNNDLDTQFLWSLQQQNTTKTRRQRRKWLESDDHLLIAAIKQFGCQWNENPDQWQQIVDQCTFSHPFSLKDVRKHWRRVLKQKLLDNTNNNHTTQTANNC